MQHDYGRAKISVRFDHGDVQYLLSEHDLAVHHGASVNVRCVCLSSPALYPERRGVTNGRKGLVASSPLTGTSSQKQKFPWWVNPWLRIYCHNVAPKNLVRPWRIAHPGMLSRQVMLLFGSTRTWVYRTCHGYLSTPCARLEYVASTLHRSRSKTLVNQS